MKNFTSEKLVCLSRENNGDRKDEKYLYGSTEINVSEFASLVDNKNCVVITFDRSQRDEDWKKDIAGYFGLDLSTCGYDNYSVYGKAV